MADLKRIMMRVAWMRHAAYALALLVMLAAAMPVRAQQPHGSEPVSPDASAVKEQALLNENSRIEGRIDIPDVKARVLIQPAGRTWDRFHEVILHWFGAIMIPSAVVVLALGYFLLGRLRISSGRSGKKVARFTGFERFSHWLTAVSFVLLGLTGLNITFGKLLVLPLIGPEAFGNFAQIAKYVHDFISFSFVIGLASIVVLWIKDNIPDRVDIDWMKQGGGFIKSKHAHARRFNAGEKMIFWFSLFAGVAVTVSGYFLLFPFYWTDIAGMQIAQAIHAVVAVLFVAVILGHIYMGTIGMEGGFEAMATGEVDLNWAKEHHDLWLEDVLAKGPAAEPGQPSRVPVD